VHVQRLSVVAQPQSGYVDSEKKVKWGKMRKAKIEEKFNQESHFGARAQPEKRVSGEMASARN
jgi:hypothetical protein